MPTLRLGDIAHARSGDAVSIAGYIGRGTTFDEMVADFAVVYADQAERDHQPVGLRTGPVKIGQRQP